MRSFNVFSDIVVAVPNETFTWVANENEGSSIVVSSSNWGLALPSYTVPGAGSATATASGPPGTVGTFSCQPPAENVSTQTLVIASQGYISICDDVMVGPGDYFVWQNTTSEPVVISPDPANPDFWPLESQQHTVPPNGFLAVLVPADAVMNNEYPLVVAMEGGAGACDEATQPKIIIGSNSPK